MTSIFADLEGITNLWGKPIGSLARRSSTFPPSFRGNGTFSLDGSGNQGSPNNRSWGSRSHDRDEFADFASPPTLSCCR